MVACCTPDREWGGTEITEEYADDLVDDWHSNTDPDYLISIDAFICANTGWTLEECRVWLATGKMPY